MRKTTLGITVLVGLGLAGTASADDVQGYYDGTDDGYAYADPDDAVAYSYDTTPYSEDAQYEYDTDDWDDYDGQWITPTIAVPVVRTVVVEPRAGWIWVQGRWRWNLNRQEWVWKPGHWVRERANFAYIPGRWEINQGRHRYFAGHWRPRQTRVIVNNRYVTNRYVTRNHRPARDHNWRNDQPRRNVVVRDHRGNKRNQVRVNRQIRDQRQAEVRANRVIRDNRRAEVRANRASIRNDRKDRNDRGNRGNRGNRGQGRRDGQR
jgi:hypothetical protein